MTDQQNEKAIRLIRKFTNDLDEARDLLLELTAPVRVQKQVDKAFKKAAATGGKHKNFNGDE